MTALAPAFRSVDRIAGLKLNYRKCCWVQYGTEERESLRTWISENFRRVTRDANCSTLQKCWNHDWPRWTHSSLVSTLEKFIQRVLKINASTKSLVERLCHLKIYAIAVLSFIGSVCAPDKATLKAENHALQCTTAGPYHAYRLNFLELAPCVAMVLTLWASTPSALRLAIELLHARPHLAKSLTKSKRLVDTIAFLFSPSLPSRRKSSLHPPMACSTANAFDNVCRLDCDGKLDEAPQNKKQKVATGLLRDKLYEQDFAGPISLRASQVLGPISRHRVADILHHMKLVSRASRPGLTVGVLSILCNGLCTAQISH